MGSKALRIGEVAARVGLWWTPRAVRSIRRRSLWPGQWLMEMTVIGSLRPTGKPGTYSGRVLYTMGGEWKLKVRVVWPKDPFELQLTEQVQD